MSTTHYLAAITDETHALMVRGARLVGAQYTRAGGRAVVTHDEPSAVYTAAGVAPSIITRDNDRHEHACKEWL